MRRPGFGQLMAVRTGIWAAWAVLCIAGCPYGPARWYMLVSGQSNSMPLHRASERIRAPALSPCSAAARTLLARGSASPPASRHVTAATH